MAIYVYVQKVERWIEDGQMSKRLIAAKKIRIQLLLWAKVATLDPVFVPGSPIILSFTLKDVPKPIFLHKIFLNKYLYIKLDQPKILQIRNQFC